MYYDRGKYKTPEHRLRIKRRRMNRQRRKILGIKIEPPPKRIRVRPPKVNSFTQADIDAYKLKMDTLFKATKP